MANVPIIVYIHLCQKPYWHVTFNKIMSALRESELYDNLQEIRLGIVNDHGQINDDPSFHDPKISTVFFNHSSMYERATLLHMRRSAANDNAQYLYVHSKGLKYLDGSQGEHKKNCVMDWVDLMLHWNVYNWRLASEKLFSHDVYGCEFFCGPEKHFSGNFWWANSHYVNTLPEHIGPEYCDPEFWICKRDKVIICNIHSTGLSSGGELYSNRYIKGVNY